MLVHGKIHEVENENVGVEADIRARNLPSAALAVHTAMQNAVIS